MNMLIDKAFKLFFLVYVPKKFMKICLLASKQGTLGTYILTFVPVPWPEHPDVLQALPDVKYTLQTDSNHLN